MLKSANSRLTRAKRKNKDELVGCPRRRGIALQSTGSAPCLPCPAVAALLLTALVYGEVAIHTEHLTPTFTAAALQGNINQNVDQNAAYNARVVQTFNAQSRDAAARGAKLVVWPETAYPGYLQNFDPTECRWRRSSRRTIRPR